jgi:hypothetical protein
MWHQLLLNPPQNTFFPESPATTSQQEQSGLTVEAILEPLWPQGAQEICY